MKILVIQQKMIGDVLTSSILFEALKEKYPTAELHYLVNSHTFPVIENNPFIDKILFFTPEHEKSRRKLFSLCKQIKKNKYDAVIDVYVKISSNLIVLFSNAKFKIGYFKKHSKYIYTHPLNRKKKTSYNVSLAIENRMLLLQPLGIEFSNFNPKIYLSPTEIENANKQLISHNIHKEHPLYMISVLGSSIAKTYPPEYMATLLDGIIEQQKDAQLLFNYIPNQLEKAKEIFNLCTPITQSRIFFNLYGKNLREFMALTYHCKALIGNEGGAVNMAKALQIPTFIIFNPALNKKNWFGEEENSKHSAVHLADYTEYKPKDYKAAKKDSITYYKKFKPTFILPNLIQFLKQL